jgi:hypothetical protein
VGRVAIHTSVEDCLRLDTASDAVRSRLRLGCVSSGRWTWSRDGEPFAVVGYTVNGLRGERLALELEYRISGRPVRQFITLVQTSPHYGGIRWWFLCPTELARGVERRVRCLYLPLGQSHFAGRVAHKLNYESQKVSSLARTISRLLAEHRASR